jgi:hypothetical protein
MMNCSFAKNKKHLELIRDVFVFCCFTGLSYIDVKELSNDDIVLHFDNKLRIKDKRQKTNTNIGVPLLDEALKIVEKYKGKAPDNRVLPVPSNFTCNINIKKVANLCDIKRKSPITFHVSRHTFATSVMLNMGVPIEHVRKALAHKNIKTTEHYAKLLDTCMSNQFTALNRKINGILNDSTFKAVDFMDILKALKITNVAPYLKRTSLKIWDNLTFIEQNEFAGQIKKQSKHKKVNMTDLHEELIEYFVEIKK